MGERRGERRRVKRASVTGKGSESRGRASIQGQKRGAEREKENKSVSVHPFLLNM